jgi:hypothetical protein
VPDWSLGTCERTAEQLQPAAVAVVSVFGVIFAQDAGAAANEGPDAFRVTSRYVVVSARRA